MRACGKRGCSGRPDGSAACSRAEWPRHVVPRATRRHRCRQVCEFERHVLPRDSALSPSGTRPGVPLTVREVKDVYVIRVQAYAQSGRCWYSLILFTLIVELFCPFVYSV